MIPTGSHCALSLTHEAPFLIEADASPQCGASTSCSLASAALRARHHFYQRKKVTSCTIKNFCSLSSTCRHISKKVPVLGLKISRESSCSEFLQDFMLTPAPKCQEKVQFWDPKSAPQGTETQKTFSLDFA